MATATELQQLYVAYFGRPADPAGLNYWVSTGISTRSFAALMHAQPEFQSVNSGLSVEAQVNQLYLNLFGRSADSAGLLYWTQQINTGSLKLASIANDLIFAAARGGEASAADRKALENKTATAVAYTDSIKSTNSALINYQPKSSSPWVSGFYLDTAVSFLKTVTATNLPTAAQITASVVPIAATAAPGKTFALTAGPDTGTAFIGSSGNDTFDAIATAAGAATFSLGDAIDGGDGNDTLNVLQTAAITMPLAVKVKNIETANFTSGTTANVIDTTDFTGLTTLNVTGVTAQTVTAAATTDVTVTGTTATGATAVDGGKSVTIVESGASSGTVKVGSTTAAAGAVAVTSTIKAADTSVGNAITVKGGSSIAITQKGVNAVNTEVTDGAVTVTGDANTKTVVVTSDKAASKGAKVVGHVNGAIEIADVNADSSTAAGAIETVTINSGAAVKVNSGALKTLNLTGTITKVDATKLGALTTAANTTLALNVNGLTTTDVVEVDTDITTLNVGSSTSASTIKELKAAGATTVNISGDAKLTLQTNTLGAATSIVVTNTAGTSFESKLATGTAFTGGVGADTVKLSDSFTKVITMGAGADSVTVDGTGIGEGGSVSAGDGIDTIVMTAAQAATFDNNATFNSKFSGFEILEIGASGANTIVLAGINGVNRVITKKATGALVLDGFSSGGTLTLNDDVVNGGDYEAKVTNAKFSASDTFNIDLSKSTLLTAGKVTVADVETIKFTAADAASNGSDAVIHTATLVATSATTVSVSGNNGLTLTNTGNTAITKFDASGVVANGEGDTNAKLAVTFASANTTTTDTVTITGGAGNDTLTGGASKDVINGGAGADIIQGSLGQDTLVVGNGRDVVRIASSLDVAPGAAFTDSSTSAADIISGYVLASAFTSTDLSDVAKFQASTVGGANLSMLSIFLLKDDGNADADKFGTKVDVKLESDSSGAGQAAGVTYTVKNGLLTFSGAGASGVDTLGEYLTEAAAVASTDGETLAFVFGGDTYLFAQNSAQDLLVQLTGVAASSLVLASNTAAASAGAVIIGNAL